MHRIFCPTNPRSVDSTHIGTEGGNLLTYQHSLRDERQTADETPWEFSGEPPYAVSNPTVDDPWGPGFGDEPDTQQESDQWRTTFEPRPSPHPATNPPPSSTAGGRPSSNGRRGVLVDGEVLYPVAGDLLLDAEQLAIYQAERSDNEGDGSRPLQALRVTDDAETFLIGVSDGGRPVRWSPGAILTYCVLRNTFPRPDWYREVVEDMRTATSDWEKTCGVEFDYVAEADNSNVLRPPGVLMPVRHISAGGAFIAAAFFPTDPPSRWRVLIDPSFHTTQYDHAGVLRHELGHALGFRHEHIRSGAPEVCPNEDLADTVDLTAYDPQSVMHYFCGGVGSREMQITEVDRRGSQTVYGPPLSNFELIQP